MEEPNRTRNLVALLACVAVAAVLRWYGLRWGLPEVYEEAAPLHRAWGMWGWGAGKRLDLNPHFFYYPSLTIYMQFLGQGILYLLLRLFGVIGSTMDFQVLYLVDRTPIYLTARMITVLFGVATVLYVYRLGRRIAGDWAAIPAALLLAVNTLHVDKSQVIEVDVPLAFFTVLALWFAVGIISAPTRRNYLLAGISAGLAASTKYPGAIVGLSIVAAHLAARRKLGQMRPSWKLLVASIAAAAVAFFATSPYVLLDAPTFLEHFSTERMHIAVGHFGLDESVTWTFYLEALVSRILGWPLAVLALAGVAVAAFHRRPWAIVLAAFFVPFLIAISSWSMRVDRYALPLVPVAILVVGGLIAELSGLPRFARLGRRGRVALVSLAVLLAAAPTIASYPDLWARLGEDTRTRAKEWIQSNIPAGSFVAVELYGPELFGPHDISALDEDVRQRVVERMRGTPSYAVQPIPMFSLKPERSEVFYDLSLYEEADIFVTSSTVKSRYLAEPARFARQAAFYDELERSFSRVAEFVANGGPGPTVTVYRNPRHHIPFGGRPSVGLPAPLRHGGITASGSEELFYKNLGLNYEVFGHYEGALAAYDLAFRYPIVRPEVYNLLVLRKTLCLLALGRAPEAARFLDAVIAEAGTPPEARERFKAMRRDIRSRAVVQ